MGKVTKEWHVQIIQINYFSAFIQVAFLLTELFHLGVGRPHSSELDQILAYM